MGRIGVGVGQPDVQREQRGFQGQPDRDEARRDQDGLLIRDFVNAQLHVRQVERAGHHVNQADADQVEGGADGAHQQVLEHGRQRSPVRPAGHQHVAGQRGDFHENENIEGVGRDQDAGQAGQRQQPGGVEQRLAAQFDLAFEAGLAGQQRQRGSAGYNQQQQRAETVDQQFDAVRRRPAAERVAILLPAQHTGSQLHRDREGHRAGGRRRGPGQPARPQQDHQRRDQQRHHDLQRRQMCVQAGHRRSISWISCSSVVPYSSLMRTTMPSPSAVVEMPTTMAVRISTCGSGLE